MVWSTCRKVMLRGYEINKSNARKKYPETKKSKEARGERYLGPSKRTVSKTGAGAFWVLKADLPGL